jgi:hypothetical protein
MSASSIARLNDALRTTFLTGKVVFTPGIRALADHSRSAVVEAVQRFDEFTEDNDPYSEHDFGAIDLPTVGKVFWKIDYYDPTMRFLSEDPADQTKTRRVLTIMLAEEY